MTRPSSDSNLTDAFGNAFQEGDLVAVATSRGMRVGKVVEIVQAAHSYWLVPRVVIELSLHNSLPRTNRARMVQKVRSYEYYAPAFLKLDAPVSVQFDSA